MGLTYSQTACPEHVPLHAHSALPLLPPLPTAGSWVSARWEGGAYTVGAATWGWGRLVPVSEAVLAGLFCSGEQPASLH